jgi:hypothetical protein
MCTNMKQTSVTSERRGRCTDASGNVPRRTQNTDHSVIVIELRVPSYICVSQKTPKTNERIVVVEFAAAGCRWRTRNDRSCTSTCGCVHAHTPQHRARWSVTVSVHRRDSRVHLRGRAPCARAPSSGRSRAESYLLREPNVTRDREREHRELRCMSMCVV